MLDVACAFRVVDEVGAHRALHGHGDPPPRAPGAGASAEHHERSDVGTARSGMRQTLEGSFSVRGADTG